MFRKNFLIYPILTLLLSGCIRLTGGATYYKQTPEETKEKTIGFDTAKIMENKQTRGSITTN